MKTILTIMITELKILFYSPIAWLILIIFTFQAGAEFCTLLGSQVNTQMSGYSLYGATNSVLSGYGMFSHMLDNLYFYIPLLTMGLVSRELSSGSIKLLYSSPVSNLQIIMGKYLSVMMYGLLLTFILFIFAMVGYISIDNADMPLILTALLGIYLTLCAYGAIGLFMSTITYYQVVAAIGTLVILAILNYVGRIGQDISFVRDITYWLSISGRSESLLSGMLSSKDIIYFVLVISLFIMLSIVKLQGERLKVTRINNVTKYGVTILVVLFLGYISSLPAMSKYYDSTFNKANTLTRESQEVVAKLDGGLKITTYVNFLESNYHKGAPSSINSDKSNFNKYVRFKPEIKMEYVYYYDTVYNSVHEQLYPDLNTKQRFDTLCKIYDHDPKLYKTPLEIRKIINLSEEGNRFVRVLERENGNKTFLRIFDDQQVDPSENEITAALKSIIAKSPKVGFVTGHNERNTDGIGDRSYSTFATSRPFRHSLLNQGFIVSDIRLDSPVRDDIDIIVISDMRSPYTDEEMANFDQFLARGGNMIILGEPRRQENMNSILAKFGLRFGKGTIVQPQEERSADLITGSFTNFALGIRGLNGMIGRRYCVTMPSVCPIETINYNSGFEVLPLIVTAEKGVWNEMETTNFIDEIPTIDSTKNEREKSFDLMMYAKRSVGEKEQRIFIIGDADCISSGEVTISRKNIAASNYNLIISMFQELSYDNFPITTTKVHPRDCSVSIDNTTMGWLTIFLKWVFPSILLVGYLLIWFIRRGR